MRQQKWRGNLNVKPAQFSARGVLQGDRRPGRGGGGGDRGAGQRRQEGRLGGGRAAVVVVAPCRRGGGGGTSAVGVAVGAVVGAVGVFGGAHLRPGGGLLHPVF